jgi:hypothetical protein
VRYDICVIRRLKVKYNEEGVEQRLVICSAYLPYDSEDPP